MTDIIASFIVHVHLSNAIVSFFCNGNCCLIASTVSAYSLRQILPRLVVNGAA